MKLALVALILCSLVVAEESHSDQPKGTKPRRITAGDLLNISVWREPNLTVTLSVRSDGTISFPLLNELQAAGLNPDELEKVITEKLRRYPGFSSSYRVRNDRNFCPGNSESIMNRLQPKRPRIPLDPELYRQLC